ncbi:hypothetical protein UFOVP223_8 [uncultured Caudovirales phage]|uniref:Uncharacterized protein n=1 Tax=uncultured Caudovirales phage TaxID=2100421 RepID=A0A6J5L0J0_9CAUD|nr:hypothetical protein UFOVP110_22 [uncultured Caudovirales phage]CAB5218908.1 hypothetical protein UFOVP223_8 [uncultured Caudovirales phage]
MADFSVVSSQVGGTSFQDRGLPWKNNPVELPLPGNGKTFGGPDSRLAKIYAIRKNQTQLPDPYMQGRNQTVNM